MRKKVQWQKQQDQIIACNFLAIKRKKWKTISQLLKEHGFEKRQTQCRQRYINHLEPNLDKQSSLNVNELKIFYRKFDQYGAKWAHIKTFLPKKSQTQLKNIFYGHMRCFLKKIVKYFTKKTAVFINNFTTLTLQQIYFAQKKYKMMKFLRQDIIKLIILDKQQNFIKLIRNRQDMYRSLIQIIFSENSTKQWKYYTRFRQEFGLNVQFQQIIKIQYSDGQNNQIVQQIKDDLILSQFPQKLNERKVQSSMALNPNIIQNYINSTPYYQTLNQYQTNYIPFYTMTSEKYQECINMMKFENFGYFPSQYV